MPPIFRSPFLIVDFTWSGMFEPGVKYFATVTACNRGSMCTVQSSNGVIMDDSPPVPGLVHVGFSDYHEPFLPQKYVKTINRNIIIEIYADVDVEHITFKFILVILCLRHGLDSMTDNLVLTILNGALVQRRELASYLHSKTFCCQTD